MLSPGKLVKVTPLGEVRLYNNDPVAARQNFKIEAGDVYLVLKKPVKHTDHYELFAEWGVDVLVGKTPRKIMFTPRSGECLSDYLKVVDTNEIPD